MEATSCVCKIERMDNDRILVGQKHPKILLFNWKKKILEREFDLHRLDWNCCIQTIQND